MSWTAGYVTDISYTFGYYSDLNPRRIPLAFLYNGIIPPEIRTACDLGFGQGISVNCHCASQSDAGWWGTDFNPAQAAFARMLADAAGSGAHLFDQSFAEFCTRSDLPEFDFIGLHGIWSWISDENRALIVDFVRRKLKVGGVLYVSYNTLPGLAPMVPLRHLLTRHTEVMGASGQGTVRKIDASLDFAEKLFALSPQYARDNPQIVERLAKFKDQNRHYLAHEYFNRDWHPMPFADMAHRLEQAKLTYACSSRYSELIHAMNFTVEQQQFLQEIPDASFRETVRDYFVNQQFRRDYWVKGALRLSPLERKEALRKQRVILAVPREGIALKAWGALGESTLQESVYTPLLDALADHQPKSLAQLEQTVKEHTISFEQIVEAVMVLVGVDTLMPVQDEKIMAKSKPRTDKLNAQFMDKSRSSNDISHLASPVAGGGKFVSRFSQLFLLARANGKKTPEEWGAFAWKALADQGQRIVINNRILETPEENLAEMKSDAEIFADKHLPVLKALGIA
ncbi:MAG: methyltransferase [Desulfuromonadales bacterium]|nr:MAG: methyltransferase [Desulfuromonadales bacterium]